MEHKSGICNNKGKEFPSPANDMGTIRSYPEKINKFGDNIYCIFVKYSVLKDDTIQVEDVYFNKIYTFIGKGRSFRNQLQYREKDGNLRPKNWSDMSNNIIYFPTIESFQEALAVTNQFRSKQIIIKHLEKIDNTSYLKEIKSLVDKRLNDYK